MSQTQVTVPFRNGYNFGVGVDLLSGEPRNQSVNSDVINSNSEGNRGSGIVIQRIRTTKGLEEILGIDAQASLGTALFAGNSARFDFVKDCRVESSSLFMAIAARVSLKVLSIDAPSLRKEASAVVDRPDIFDQRFGNVFVRTIERGGLFVTVMRIETSSSEDSFNISSELEGDFGELSTDSESKLSNKFAKIARDPRFNMSFQTYREGGPVDLATSLDASEVLANANLFLHSFATNADAMAVPNLVTLAPITIADGPQSPISVDLENAQNVLRFCATRRSLFLDQLNLLQQFAERVSRYDFSNGANPREIATAAANTQADLDLIGRCARAAINSPSRAKFPTDFAVAIGETFPTATVPAILPVVRPRP